MKELKHKKKVMKHFDDEIDQEADCQVDMTVQEELDRNLKLLHSVRTKKIKKMRQQGEESKAPSKPAKPVQTSNWQKFKAANPETRRDKKYLAIDCEMVMCQVKDEQVHKLARVSIVDQSLNLIFDSYVKPQYKVVNYLTWVSGITYQKIAHAPTYTQIFRRLCGLLEGAVLVGHTIENDMKVLPNLRNKTIDIKQFSRYKSEGGLPFSLKKLASRELGLSIQEGEHNSGEDARATMQLFAKFKQQIVSQLQ